jgi:hypothetical protein
VFYLRVHDSLKEVFTLLSENAQFVAVSGDTLFQLRYIPGLRYEHIYKKSDAGISGFTFHTLVNGASVAEKQRVIIQILNRRESGILLENKFIFRDKCE